ncbi:unnamed protein product, partial [Hapterophycus canaliculatus]
RDSLLGSPPPFAHAPAIVVRIRLLLPWRATIASSCRNAPGACLASRLSVENEVNTVVLGLRDGGREGCVVEGDCLLASIDCQRSRSPLEEDNHRRDGVGTSAEALFCLWRFDYF